MFFILAVLVINFFFGYDEPENKIFDETHRKYEVVFHKGHIRILEFEDGGCVLHGFGKPISFSSKAKAMDYLRANRFI